MITLPSSAFDSLAMEEVVLVFSVYANSILFPSAGISTVTNIFSLIVLELRNAPVKDGVTIHLELKVVKLACVVLVSCISCIRLCRKVQGGVVFSGNLIPLEGIGQMKGADLPT